MTTVERAPVDRDERRSDEQLTEQVAQLQLADAGEPLCLSDDVHVRRHWTVPADYNHDATFISIKLSAAPDDSLVLHDAHNDILVLNRDGSTRAQLHTTKGDSTQKLIAPNNELIELCSYSQFGPSFRGNAMRMRSLDGQLRRSFMMGMLGSVVQQGFLVDDPPDVHVQVNRMVVDRHNNYHVVFEDAEAPPPGHCRLNCGRIVSMTADGQYLRTIEVVPPTNVTKMVACGDYLVLLGGHWLSGASKPVNSLLVYTLDGTLVHSAAPGFTVAGCSLSVVHAIACDQHQNLLLSLMTHDPSRVQHGWTHDIAVLDVQTLALLRVVQSPRPVNAMAVDRHGHLLCLDWVGREIYQLY